MSKTYEIMIVIDRTGTYYEGNWGSTDVLMYYEPFCKWETVTEKQYEKIKKYMNTAEARNNNYRVIERISTVGEGSIFDIIDAYNEKERIRLEKAAETKRKREATKRKTAAEKKKKELEAARELLEKNGLKVGE